METKHTETDVYLTRSAEVNLRDGQKVVVGDSPLVTQLVVERFMGRPHEEIIAAVEIPAEEGSKLLLMIARATDGSGEVTLVHFLGDDSEGTTAPLGTNSETPIDRHCIITVAKGEVGITDTSEHGTKVFLGSAEEPFSTR